MGHRGPNSPVGHMTNLTLELTRENFRILDLETPATGVGVSEFREFLNQRANPCPNVAPINPVPGVFHCSAAEGCVDSSFWRADLQRDRTWRRKEILAFVPLKVARFDLATGFKHLPDNLALDNLQAPKELVVSLGD